MMVEVVQAGTGTAAQIPGVVVAGKTGTAETCSCNTVYDAWFIFFAPAEQPDRRGRRPRRGPEQRLRRGDRRSDRQAADAGDPAHDDESERGKPWPLTSKTA